MHSARKSVRNRWNGTEGSREDDGISANNEEDIKL
jgi:hypothetical protein